MRYAINLNLDYASHSQSELKALFRTLREEFIQAGFRQDGRLFTIALPEAEACRLASDIVEKVARRNGFGDVYRYIKEFYGFNFERANNLLLPPAHDIAVEIMEELSEMDLVDLKLLTNKSVS